MQHCKYYNYFVFYCPTWRVFLIISFSSSSINTKKKFWDVPHLLHMCVIFSPNLWPLNNYKMFFLLFKMPFVCISVFSAICPVDNWFRGLFKINLKVYDVINCLNKNLITFCWVSWEEKFVKLCQLIKYWIRNIFPQKSCRKCALNADPRLFFNFHK